MHRHVRHGARVVGIVREAQLDAFDEVLPVPEIRGDLVIDSHVPMSVVEKRMQGCDHPVLVGVPETHYLKCFILRRVE